MKIEFAKINDAKEILRMLNSTNEVQTIEGKLDYDINFVRAIISDKKLHICLVARDKSNISGVLIALLWPKIKEIFTLDLIVKPEYRKKGVGTQLNNYYENMLKKRGIKYISSFVLIKNKKMQKLKKKLNYIRGKKFYFYGKNLR